MKLKVIARVVFCLTALVACDASDKMPPAIKTATDARALLAGKTWHVTDVGLNVFSFSEPASSDILTVEWFSATKTLGEYESEARENFNKASIELTSDTVAHTVNLGLSGKQRYLITDESKEDTPTGVRLELTGGSDDFKDMGITEATYTYLVLAANEKNLVLQAPNEINNRKVVLLLRAN